MSSATSLAPSDFSPDRILLPILSDSNFYKTVSLLFRSDVCASVLLLSSSTYDLIYVYLTSPFIYLSIREHPDYFGDVFC